MNPSQTIWQMAELIADECWNAGADMPYWMREHAKEVITCPECGAPGYDWRHMTYEKAMRQEMTNDPA